MLTYCYICVVYESCWKSRKWRIKLFKKKEAGNGPLNKPKQIKLNEKELESLPAPITRSASNIFLKNNILKCCTLENIYTAHIRSFFTLADNSDDSNDDDDNDNDAGNPFGVLFKEACCGVATVVVWCCCYCCVLGCVDRGVMKSSQLKADLFSTFCNLECLLQTGC